MKNLTENQQNIINSITSEFMRINRETEEKRVFNLIDSNALIGINEEIRRNKQESEAIKKYWHQLAMDEAERLAVLLQQDLPMACVERFGKSNGKVDAPSVIIQRQKGLSGHHENYVSFDVVLIFGDYVKQSHGCGYQECVGLEYRYNSKNYTSAEKLFAMSGIANEIRNKIIR
jgi:hypothetical protein